MRLADVKQVLSVTIEELDGSTVDWVKSRDAKAEVGTLQARKNGWSRSARRKGKDSAVVRDGEPMPAGARPSSSADEKTFLLEAMVTMRVEDRQVKVEAEWTKGFDRARKDWATLWAYLIRRLVDRAKEVDTAPGAAVDAMEP